MHSEVQSRFQIEFQAPAIIVGDGPHSYLPARGEGRISQTYNADIFELSEISSAESLGRG